LNRRIRRLESVKNYASAFQFGRMPLLHVAVNGDIEIAVAQPIVEEGIRVLREKFHWDGYRLQHAKQQILDLPGSSHRRKL
jgi:hypothetical protein